MRYAYGLHCSGPRMSADDGRLVSNFVVAALKGEPLQVYGDGEATRSLMVRLNHLCAPGDGA